MYAAIGMTPEQASRIQAYEDRLARDLLAATQLSLWEMLRRTAKRFPQNAAIQSEDSSVSYLELVERALRCASRLKGMGIGRGSRVSLLFHNCEEWAVVHYGLMRLGAIVVPINTAYEADEVRWVLERGESELIIAPERAVGIDFAKKLERVDSRLVHGAVDVARLPALQRIHLLPTRGVGLDSESDAYRELFGDPGEKGLDPRSPVTGSDPAYVLFTSGSTSRPKPALCRGGAYVANAVALSRSLDFGPGDVYPAYNPTFHSSGLIWSLTLPHAVGGAGYLIPKFDGAAVLDVVTSGRITHAGAFDTMFTMMMAAPGGAEADVSHIRAWSVGCTPSFLRRVLESWDLRGVGSIYGSTESSGLCALVPWDVEDSEVRIGSNGRPLPGVELRIVDPESGKQCDPGEPGEICFRGWCLFIEYLGMPEEMEAAFDDEGFFHSGDYGWLDDDGYLYFRGRYKMMIKTGGENVAQREVEIFLEETLPFVNHAEVVGVPDDVWGEAVVAFVEYVDGRSRTVEELRDLCRGKIANFKIPKHFIEVEAGCWPVLGSGRVDKPKLQRRANETWGELR
ncbi:acyl--CoA ligase [Myxococcota bacterium]|nr:acyl--CoA ligase [Myxococcota bacterium]